ADVEEVLHDREKFIQDTQTFLEKFNRFSFGFTPRVLTIAWERIDRIKEYLEKSPNAVTTILPTEEPEHSLCMGYEHLSTIPKTESDKVTESNAENLLPIPSKCEVTLEDEIECDMPAKDVCSLVFTNFSNPLFKDNDNFDSSDDDSLSDEDVPAEEFKIYSNPLGDEDEINSEKLDPHCFNIESDFVESLLNRDTFIDFSSKFDFSEELNAEITDTIIKSIRLLPIPVQDGNSQQEEIDIVTETNDVLPLIDDNEDDLSNDSLLEEADLFLVSDNLIPPGIENVDPEGDVHFLEELLIDDSILSYKSFDSSFEDKPSIPRPPPEPPDIESFFDLKPDVIAEEILDKLNEDKCFKPVREINVSTKIENDDYFPFMFVIRFFLPYFIFPEISPLLLSTESEDTIFDPGQGFPGKNKTPGPWSARVPMWQLFKRLGEQEVKNIVEQPAGCRNRAEKSLQNFRFIHKSSISFKNTSQISSIHSIAPIQSTKEPEHSLSMGDDESLPDEDVPAEEFKIYSNPLCDEDEINVESDFVESLLNHDTFIDFSPKFDFSELNAEITDTVIESIPIPIPVQDGEADLFLSDNSIPPGIENITDDPEGDPDVIAEEISDKLNEDKCFEPGREINVSTNNKDVDYFPFMFVIRIFFPYLILPEISPLLLSAESEDTIFDPGISE
nr:hypothetical protein [Tanacetum cinerariifolium]